MYKSIKMILGFIALFASQIHPQSILFEPSRLHYAVTGLPWAVESGDFNNDNFADFVTASRQERSITLRLGNGDGTFGDSLNFEVGISPRSLIPADFNNDNNLDVAVANLLSNDVTVLLGDGNANFPVRYTYQIGDKPRSIIAVDFNLDNELDLAVANRDANSISILLGLGDGTFAAPLDVNTTSAMNPRQLRSGDLNNDTFPDIVMVHDEQSGSSVGQKYGVLLGKGDGTFDPILVTIINAGNGFPEAVSLTLGHFDTNQNLDMVVTLNNSAEDEIVSFAGNGNGTFIIRDIVTVGTAPFHIINFDLNKDGFPDILVSNTGSNKVTLHTNRGDGTFRNSIPGGSLFDLQKNAFRVGSAPRWITLADLNGDAKMDLLAANEGGNDVSVLLANSDTTFVMAPQYNVGSPPQAFPSGGAVNDFNEDGFLDLAISNWGYPNDPGGVSILIGNGDGTFLPKVNYGVGDNPKKIISRDYNSDSYLDLAVLNSRDSVFSLLTGKGDGTFNSALNFSLQINPIYLKSMTDMASGDFDENGLEDIVIINYNEDYLAFFFGDSQTVFNPVQKLFLSDAWPERLLVADFNGDSHDDVLVQKDAQFIGQSNTADVYLGDGNGGFSSPVVNGWTGGNTFYIITADFDNDNILDLGVLDENFQTFIKSIFLFQGNMDGSFSQINSFVLDEPSGLLALNIVGDDNLDLLVGSSDNYDVSILEGSGDFSFSERWPSYGTGTSVRHLNPGDFDKDGDLDIATTGGVPSESFVYLLINRSSTTGILGENGPDASIPSIFQLEQNYPNPFNPTTQFSWQLAVGSQVQLRIYNLSGQKVMTLVDEYQSAGTHSIQFDGSHLASGIYYYSLEVDRDVKTKKMVLLR